MIQETVSVMKILSFITNMLMQTLINFFLNVNFFLVMWEIEYVVKSTTSEKTINHKHFQF